MGSIGVAGRAFLALEGVCFILAGMPCPSCQLSANEVFTWPVP